MSNATTATTTMRWAIDPTDRYPDPATHAYRATIDGEPVAWARPAHGGWFVSTAAFPAVTEWARTLSAAKRYARAAMNESAR